MTHSQEVENSYNSRTEILSSGTAAFSNHKTVSYDTLLKNEKQKNFEV